MILSGICLFIGYTKALPQKVGILGLDLSNNSHVTGWFILAITFYFFAMFFIFGIVELIKYYLPDIVIFQSKNIIGNTLGLTEKECVEDDAAHNLNEDDVGTARTEYRDIQNQKNALSSKYHSIFIFVSNALMIFLELIFPIALWCFGSFKLYIFLEYAY